MRVDLSQLTAAQLTNEQDTRKVSDQKTGASDLSGSEDRTTFTSDSSSVSSLAAKAMNTPEIRENLVASLRQSISSGQYKLDPSAIASSMIDEHA